MSKHQGKDRLSLKANHKYLDLDHMTHTYLSLLISGYRKKMIISMNTTSSRKSQLDE
jgi:hypothetical protein